MKLIFTLSSITFNSVRKNSTNNTQLNEKLEEKAKTLLNVNKYEKVE